MSFRLIDYDVGIIEQFKTKAQLNKYLDDNPSKKTHLEKGFLKIQKTPF
jgi:hypothetical protein